MYQLKLVSVVKYLGNDISQSVSVLFQNRRMLMPKNINDTTLYAVQARLDVTL